MRRVKMIKLSAFLIIIAIFLICLSFNKNKAPTMPIKSEPEPDVKSEPESDLNPTNEKIYIDIKLVGELTMDIKDVDFGTIDTAESRGWKPFMWWWQVNNLEPYYEQNLIDTLQSSDFPFNFKEHYYIISFGRKLNKIWIDKSEVYTDGISPARQEFDMEHYQENTLFIYEMEKRFLPDILVF